MLGHIYKLTEIFGYATQMAAEIASPLNKELRKRESPHILHNLTQPTENWNREKGTLVPPHMQRQTYIPEYVQENSQVQT